MNTPSEKKMVPTYAQKWTLNLGLRLAVNATKQEVTESDKVSSRL
jgi:hypothetical protein